MTDLFRNKKFSQLQDLKLKNENIKAVLLILVILLHK